MAGEQSSQFYNQFLTEMKKAHKEDKIKNGVFGAMMDVSYFNVKKIIQIPFVYLRISKL